MLMGGTDEIAGWCACLKAPGYDKAVDERHQESIHVMPQQVEGLWQRDTKVFYWAG